MGDTKTEVYELFQKHSRFMSEFCTELEYSYLNDVIIYWRDFEHRNSRQEFRDLINEMIENIIPKTFADGKPLNIGGFRYLRHQAILDYLRNKQDVTNSKKKQLWDCYTRFANWLNMLSSGWLRKDLPSYQMSPHAMKKTLAFDQWRYFIDVLFQRNLRDELIARTIVQGQKRVSEVIGLVIDQIDFENNTIRYEAKKKIDTINYEESFMKELKSYIYSTNKLRKNGRFVFLTRTGKKVTRLSLNRSFANVCTKIGIKKVSPDSLRGIYKMFVQQGYKETAIMHSRKTRIEENDKIAKIRLKKEYGITS